MFKIYKNILHYVKELSYLTYLSIFSSFVSSFFTVGAYFFMYKFFNNLIINADTSMTKFYALMVSILLVIGSILQYVANMLSHKLGFRLETNLRKRGIDILTNASFKFFNSNASGNIRKTIDDNASQTHAIIAHLIPDNANAFMTPILILIIGFLISYRVGILLILSLIVTFLFVFLMMGKRKFMDYYQQALDDMSGKTVEYIRAIQVIKIFGIDITSFKTLHQAILSYSKNALKYSKTNKMPFVLYQWVFFGIGAIILPFVVLFNFFNTVEIVFILFLTGVLYSTMIRIMYVFMYSFKGSYAIEKLEDLFNNMKKDTLSFGNIDTMEGFDIEFKNVSFSYDEKNMVLDNLSFKLEENKVYALVGASGGGKTTIAKLISGFFNIQKGEILIGGKNIKSYTKNALIQNISFVFQNPKLFKISIYDNVKVAKPTATREEVMRALKLASCETILNKFKDRENTIIGSKGVYLSGGEIQRIAIARALLKDSKIILLDEASSAIDPDNEYELKLAISELIKDKTIIMIAHRLTSITNADEILVVENGKIEERGNNMQLMEKNQKYAYYMNLYHSANNWRVNNEKMD